MDKKELFFSDQTGDAFVTVYEVFPGVQFAYYSAHMDQIKLGEPKAQGSMIEIQHCREGRVEQELSDEFFYLMPGDLSIAQRTEMVKSYHLPLRHYHGITIGIHLDAVTSDFLQLLRAIGVDIHDIIRRLCANEKRYVIRAEKYIEHVFSELYTVPDGIREGYLKIKILELMLVLSGMDIVRSQSPARTLPKAHVRLAHQAAAYLSEHMGRHITIPELSRQLQVSDTHLKTVFKGVYGVPVFTYMRMQKMQTAAQQLLHTEKSVAAIAEELGYINASKFAAAFEAVMGASPRAYRASHIGVNSLNTTK